MDRSAKGIRIAGALLLFVNLAVFFLPMTKIVHTNYGTKEFSAFQYLQNVIIPDSVNTNSYGISVMFVVWGLLVLPVILSLVAGIIGLVGSAKQILSGIFSLVIAGVYITLFFAIDLLAPIWNISGETSVSWGYSFFISLSVSLAAAVLGIISFFVRPRRKKLAATDAIPQVQEIKKEQQNMRYNIVSLVEKNGDENMKIETVRGVMVGLAGIYQGAEIPFRDGETIRIGRTADNDLVFENQQKVSRNHCVISFHKEQQCFKIIDTSSNGSFTNGSQECLPQNMEVQLKPGTILDFGSEENRFRLE